MIHVPSYTVHCVKEMPINSREDRNLLKKVISEWENANSEENSLLVEIFGTHWNSPEGHVSLIFEHLNGGSLHNLLESIGAIPEDILRDITK